MTTEKRLIGYIQAIQLIAESKIASYKADSILLEGKLLFDPYRVKIQALEDFLKETELKSWAREVAWLDEA